MRKGNWCGPKAPWCVALLYGVGVLAYALVAYVVAEEDALRATDARLALAARSLKYLLPEDFPDRAIAPDAISSEEDLRHRARMNAYAREGGFAYVYTLTEREGRFYFAATAVTEQEAQERPSWYFYPYEDAPGAFTQAFKSGKPAWVTYNDQWGTFRSVAYPEYSPGGRSYLACADLDVGFLQRVVRKKAGWAFLGGLYFLALSLPALVLLYRAERFRAGKSEEMELLVDTVEQQIWRLEDPETYGFVNRSHASFLGRDKDEVAFRPLESVWSSEDVQTLREANAAVFQEGFRTQKHQWVTDGAGRRRLLTVIRTPRKNALGLVEYVVCSAEDVTEGRLSRKPPEELEPSAGSSPVEEAPAASGG